MPSASPEAPMSLSLNASFTLVLVPLRPLPFDFPKSLSTSAFLPPRHSYMESKFCRKNHLPIDLKLDSTSQLASDFDVRFEGAFSGD